MIDACFVCRVAARQHTLQPDVSHACAIVFAGDHGVAHAQGVSAFPASGLPLTCKQLHIKRMQCHRHATLRPYTMALSR